MQADIKAIAEEMAKVEEEKKALFEDAGSDVKRIGDAIKTLMDDADSPDLEEIYFNTCEIRQYHVDKYKDGIKCTFTLEDLFVPEADKALSAAELIIDEAQYEGILYISFAVRAATEPFYLTYKVSQHARNINVEIESICQLVDDICDEEHDAIAQKLYHGDTDGILDIKVAPTHYFGLNVFGLTFVVDPILTNEVSTKLLISIIKYNILYSDYMPTYFKNIFRGPIYAEILTTTNKRIAHRLFKDIVKDIINIHETIKENNKYKPITEAVPMVTVDDKYVEDALAGLASLQQTNPSAYKAAETYLERNFGRQLVPVEDFVNRRLSLANTKSSAKVEAPVTTRDDMMKNVANSWSEFKKSEEDALAAKNAEQPISTIWIKNIYTEGTKQFAEIELTYSNGEKDTEVQDVTDDKYYKIVYRNLKSGGRSEKVTPFDVIISMYYIAFGDTRIKWLYGPNKNTWEDWLHAPTMEKAARTWAKSPFVKSAEKKWLKQIDPTGAIVYRNGNTTIYKTESVDEADEKKQEAAVKDAVDSAKEEVSGKATAEDIKKLLPGPKLKKLRDKLVKSKVDKKTLDQFDKIVKFLDDYANGDIKESDIVDEAGKATTGLATIARGLAKLLLTLIKLTSLGIGIPAKVLVLITKWLAIGADKLNVMIKDSEDEEDQK